MSPPFYRAGSARPSVTCYTTEDLTNATQRPYGDGNGVVVAAARTTPRRIRAGGQVAGDRSGDGDEDKAVTLSSAGVRVPPSTHLRARPGLAAGGGQRPRPYAYKASGRPH